MQVNETDTRDTVERQVRTTADYVCTGIINRLAHTSIEGSIASTARMSASADRYLETSFKYPAIHKTLLLK